MDRTPSHTVMKRKHSLDVIFAPQSVAVIGASDKPGSVGSRIVNNLLGTFPGELYLVNPRRQEVFEQPCFATIGAIQAPVDLAVVAIPAAQVPDAIRECAAAGVKGAIIISAGFKEIGPAGAVLEEQICETVLATGIRVVGPNCFGVMRPRTQLNATFGTAMAQEGNVCFITQSGAMGTAILDWSFRNQVGFSAFVSIGSMLDVNWADLIDYFGEDPFTKSIVMYMESIGDAKTFLSAAREVALSKPIIVLKAGRAEAAARAVASHTGALAGSDEVFDAALRRIGVLRVEHTAELFYMAEVLAKQPRPAGPRLTILTNAGGPGVLAADALLHGGGELAPLPQATIERLNALLPPHWSHGNPIDVLADTDAAGFIHAIEAATQNPESDGFLIICAPMGIAEQTATAKELIRSVALPKKPMLASWMGGAGIAEAENILQQAGIPNFPYPETAARIFNYMWKYSYNLGGIYETPSLVDDAGLDEHVRKQVDDILTRVQMQHRTVLTEHESKRLLAAYGIPVTPSPVAHNEEDAVRLAREVGFPVVLKLHSESITHKTDVGGVKLNLQSEDAVRQAYWEIFSAVVKKAGVEKFQGVTVQPMIEQFGYEIILGSSIDQQFGPVLLFGSGGQFVEVYRDRALALPPLNSTLARRMMEQTKIYQALLGARGRKPVDLKALEKVLIRFSYLVIEQPRIKEIDINPLLVHPGQNGKNGQPPLRALDARVILHSPEVAAGALPRPVIRPYPAQYRWRVTLKNGETVNIRPIRPEDEPQMVHFHEQLSDQSVYQRYFHFLNLEQRVSHARLSRVCFIDYDRQIALVAETDGSGESRIIGVGRLVRLRHANDAEFAIVIGDAYQRTGLGTALLEKLVEIGRAEGVDRIIAEMLPDNAGMKRVCEKLGFRLHYDAELQLVLASLDLR